MSARCLSSVAAIVLLLTAGCSGDDEGGGRPTAVADGVPTARAAEDVVRAYIDALSAGDIDSANSLRCDDVRYRDDDEVGLEGLRRASAELAGLLGGIEVERIGAFEVGGHWVVGIDLVGAPRVTHVSVVEQAGRARICEEVVIGSGQHVDAMDPAGPAQPQVALSELERLTLPPDYDLAEASEAEDLFAGDPAVVASAYVRWERPAPHTPVHLFAYQTASAQDAERLADQIEAEIDNLVLDTFHGPGGVGAGYRLPGLALTLLQPPGIGPVMDMLVVTAGTTAYRIYAQLLPADSGHEAVSTVVAALIGETSSPSGTKAGPPETRPS